MLVITLLFGVLLTSSHGLDNGLALTPPMGWMSWGRNDCAQATDCIKYPNKCINANFIKRAADRLVSEGYRDAGYEYVLIDFCWMETWRTPEGLLVANRGRFPLGMKDLADYIHSKGLKFGLYYGNYTCTSYPQNMNTEILTVNTFAQWEVDYIKLDACLGPSYHNMEQGTKAFGELLKNSGRPILYSCTSNSYDEIASLKPNYTMVAETCNMWRIYSNVLKSWTSVSQIIDWYGKNQDRLAMHAGPGHWNDPDALVIGAFGLSEDQAKVQMAIWAILAAPLIMDTDLDLMRPEFKKILLNKNVINVNQDVLGKQGLRILQRSNVDVWRRELHDGSVAIAFVNKQTQGAPSTVFFTHFDLQLLKKPYAVRDLFEGETKFWQETDYFVVHNINPTGVKFFKFTDNMPSPINDNKDVHADISDFMKEIRGLISNITQAQDLRMNKLENAVQSWLGDMKNTITTKTTEVCSDIFCNNSCTARINNLEFNVKSWLSKIIQLNQIALERIDHIHEHLRILIPKTINLQHNNAATKS